MNTHTLSSLLLPWCLLVLLSACGGNRDDSVRADIDSVRRAVDSLKHVADSTRSELQKLESEHSQQHAELDRHLRCDALVSLPASIANIVENPRPYVHDDSCGLELIDQLSARCSRLRDTTALRALDAMSSEAQGTAGDYLADALVDLLLNQPAEVFRYLESHRADSTSALEKNLVAGIRAVPADSPRGRDIQARLQELESDKRLTDPERAHVREIEAEL